MKRIILYIELLLAACNTTPKNDKSGTATTGEITSIRWRDTVIDLGTVQHDKEYPVVFHCKNIGNVPLLFQKMESTCGCTVIDKKINVPLLPSQEGSIVGHFKMEDMNTYVERKIYVLANTKQQFHILRIKAYVQ